MTSSPAISAVIDGIGVGGKLVVVGASMEAIQVSPLQLISASRGIQGHASGASIDSEDTLNFSVLAKIRPMIETMPLEQAAAAYDRMMSGNARFRMVLTTGL